MNLLSYYANHASWKPHRHAKLILKNEVEANVRAEQKSQTSNQMKKILKTEEDHQHIKIVNNSAVCNACTLLNIWKFVS